LTSQKLWGPLSLCLSPPAIELLSASVSSDFKNGRGGKEKRKTTGSRKKKIEGFISV
jgi:hypothetical protein